MTLTKNRMVREIGRRTRLKNRDVQVMLEALIEVWTESLVAGERIELENFVVLEIREIDRGTNPGVLYNSHSAIFAPRMMRKLTVRMSRKLRLKLKR